MDDKTIPGDADFEAMSRKLRFRDEVLVTGGRGAGKRGVFIGIGVDSGYRVPFVALDPAARCASRETLERALGGDPLLQIDLGVVKPWPREVVCPRIVGEVVSGLEAELDKYRALAADLAAGRLPGAAIGGPTPTWVIGNGSLVLDRSGQPVRPSDPDVAVYATREAARQDSPGGMFAPQEASAYALGTRPVNTGEEPEAAAPPPGR
jgi:hypothetical protein